MIINKFKCKNDKKNALYIFKKIENSFDQNIIFDKH